MVLTDNGTTGWQLTNKEVNELVPGECTLLSENLNDAWLCFKGVR